jgi:hypothetical protein
MNDLQLTNNMFDAVGTWSTPISDDITPTPSWVSLFDQNGYDLTHIETLYSLANGGGHSQHRNHTHTALKKPWFVQPEKTQGSVLNHSLLFERKAYEGEAKQQLESWALQLPLLWKVIQLRPKWGLDFSIDWADQQGNVFEIFHYEFDSFDHDEIALVKQTLDQLIVTTDWDLAAHQLLAKKSEWHHLGFFEQSDYKCRFFGVDSERFKMVAWA